MAPSFPFRADPFTIRYRAAEDVAVEFLPPSGGGREPLRRLVAVGRVAPTARPGPDAPHRIPAALASGRSASRSHPA